MFVIDRSTFFAGFWLGWAFVWLLRGVGNGTEVNCMPDEYTHKWWDVSYHMVRNPAQCCIVGLDN